MCCVCHGDMPLGRQQFINLAVAEAEMLNRLARRLSRDSTRADDLVQETYLRALGAWRSFELRECGIRPWLTRILHGVHFNSLRRESRQPAIMEQAHLETTDRGRSQPAGNDGYSFETMDQRLVRAVERLTDSYRETLLLWAVRDLNYSEIARTLSVPIGTVMSRLYRARKQIREELHDSLSVRGTLCSFAE